MNILDRIIGHILFSKLAVKINVFIILKISINNLHYGITLKLTITIRDQQRVENDKMIFSLNETLNQKNILESERLDIQSFENKLSERKVAFKRKVAANELKVNL